VLVYVVLGRGISSFVLPNATSPGAAGDGVLFGFCVYHLTNFSTLAQYRPGIAIIDTAWSMCATAACAAIVRAVPGTPLGPIA
jgi:uncharacterized membrane protein